MAVNVFFGGKAQHIVQIMSLLSLDNGSRTHTHTHTLIPVYSVHYGSLNSPASSHHSQNVTLFAGGGINMSRLSLSIGVVSATRAASNLNGVCRLSEEGIQKERWEEEDGDRNSGRKRQRQRTLVGKMR